MRPSVLILLVAIVIVQLAWASSAAPTPAAEEKAVSYYDLLGVDRVSVGADPSLLKKAYRKLALQHHPDKAANEEERVQKQALFVRLSNAYEILSEPRLKTRYDYLLSQGTLEYDSNRDWNDFDGAHGFSRRPKTAAEKEREFKYKEAQEIFKKAQEEAEEFALWTSLTLAFGIALLPAIYLYISRKASTIADEKKRKERSSDLKQSQAILLELQAEKERQAKAEREAEREYAKQLKKDREEAVAAAAAEAASSGGASEVADDSSEWEVVDKKNGSATDLAKKEAAAADEEESDEDEKQGGGGGNKTVVKCLLCKKSFKSQQQLDNHEQSNQHKKAVKDSERGNKKSRRED